MQTIASNTIETQQEHGPAATSEEARYPVSGKKQKDRRSGSVLRVVGNLFIAVGLLTLFGIGGYYGYTEWDNQQYRQRLVQNFGADAYEPAVVTETATAVPTIAVDEPVADLTGGDVGNILGVV